AQVAIRSFSKKRSAQDDEDKYREKLPLAPPPRRPKMTRQFPLLPSLLRFCSVRSGSLVASLSLSSDAVSLPVQPLAAAAADLQSCVHGSRLEVQGLQEEGECA
ncbi:hypothetical protein PENTCL1PPCAC_19024, partial [Pristionchus entomophagus]